MSSTALNRAAHSAFVDAKIASDDHGSVDFFVEGQLVQIHGGIVPPNTSNEYESTSTRKRGKIREFTAKARMRLMVFCAKLLGESLPLFVTLTYPGIMTPVLSDPLKWKKDLDTFSKWLTRKWPNACAIWKLEPQERGAPHYHLMIWGIPFLPHLLLARRWYEIVGSGQYDHLASGISVERARTRNGVMCYAGKIYMGKDCKAFAGMVGRFWGILGRKRFQIAKPEIVPMKAGETKLFRRVARRYMASKGIRVAGQSKTLNIFTRNFALWVKVGEWACAEYLSRYNESVAVRPF